MFQDSNCTPGKGEGMSRMTAVQSVSQPREKPVQAERREKTFRERVCKFTIVVKVTFNVRGNNTQNE